MLQLCQGKDYCLSATISYSNDSSFVIQTEPVEHCVAAVGGNALNYLEFIRSRSLSATTANAKPHITRVLFWF